MRETREGEFAVDENAVIVRELLVEPDAPEMEVN